MILLKANDELKNIFGRMLKTMDANVAWNGNFVVLNNFLILSGNVRSLILSFDNRKVTTNVIELPDKEEDMDPVGDNQILANVLNMTLYAFGKWGVIKGLKVDKDYSQLNTLFYAILKDMKIIPGFRDDNFRFYKDNIQMTYEEVVQAAIEEGKRAPEEVKEGKEEKEPEEKGLGLWHNIRWGMERASFSKGEIQAYERKASRLGNNFYISAYKCPGCGRKLYMAVYPEGREFLIDTEEGKVYLARSYTCDNCNLFYTPTPGKLLREGESYVMKFGGDRDAYEDYQELLGRTAERTSNCNFNEFESERGKHPMPSVEEACDNLEEKSEEELHGLEEQIEDGFFPLMKAEPYLERIKGLLQAKEEEKKNKKKPKKKAEGSDKGAEEPEGLTQDTPAAEPSSPHQEGRKKGVFGKIHAKGKNNGSLAEDGKDISGAGKAIKLPEKEKELPGKKVKDIGQEGAKAIEEMEEDLDAEVPESGGSMSIKEKYDARMRKLNRMSLWQLRRLREQIQSDDRIDWVDKEKYEKLMRQAVYQKGEQEVRQKAEYCMNKPYGAVKRVMEEISQIECPELVKKGVLETLQEVKRKRGQEEASQLIAQMPENMSRNQYQTFRERLNQYDGEDISVYNEVLEGKRRLAERREITGMLKRAERSDRKGLMRILQQLREDGFSAEQAEPAIRQIEGKVRAIDEKVIEKICPNIALMTFDEAAQAYEKIEGGAFLPEIKTNTLEMIDKRLTKLKMDECGLLVEKLRESLSGKINEPERVHYYEVRRIMRGDWLPREAELVARALNTYATDRERYEFPIIVCDSSGRKNGKEGFILTPDHIFYNTLFSSEKIPVRSVEGLEGNTGLLSKGIYIKHRNGKRTKIPGVVPTKELKVFAEILEEFIAYLQEKPESRSIAYLSKEKHEVKCCYRCGFTYREGNVCPKCGNQANH